MPCDAPSCMCTRANSLSSSAAVVRHTGATPGAGARPWRCVMLHSALHTPISLLTAATATYVLVATHHLHLPAALEHLGDRFHTQRPRITGDQFSHRLMEIGTFNRRVKHGMMACHPTSSADTCCDAHPVPTHHVLPEHVLILNTLVCTGHCCSSESQLTQIPLPVCQRLVGGIHKPYAVWHENQTRHTACRATHQHVTECTKVSPRSSPRCTKFACTLALILHTATPALQI